MIFMKSFSRNSRATGPKIRVPTGFLSLSMSTAAFLSNFRYEPSGRRIFAAVRTTTAFTTCPFFTEPSGSAFHRYEEEIKELAHRRRLPYSFYFEEILMRKYELRRICKTLFYAKRIASRTRNAAQKVALRREIAALEKESIALQRLLSRLAERYAVRHEKRRES